MRHDLDIAVVCGFVFASGHKAVAEPATNEAMKRVGAEPLVSARAEFAALIKSDWKSLGDAIRVADLKVD